MSNRSIIPLIMGLAMIVVGSGLVYYSISLPQDLELLSRYSHRYMGNTNIIWIIGVAMIAVSVTCLLY